MFEGAFSGFSIADREAAKQFYGDVLGLPVSESMGGLQLLLPGNQHVFLYAKSDHRPATFTVLNFEVADIDRAIDTLSERGVEFLRYDTLPAPQDERGVLRGREASMGPDIAWFEDPSGNILSVIADGEA